MASLREQLRSDGPVSLAEIDTTSTPGDPGGKEEAGAEGVDLTAEIDDLQERLWANRVVDGSRRRVLVVLQGMDCSGKGGAIKGAFGDTNPRWLQITGFGRPTPAELEHHFLWRIRRALPEPGEIGIFDRSHYEDVVAVRARKVFPEEVWQARYEEINAFERSLADDDCIVVKIFLHISKEYQLERQIRRLERLDKRWKFSEGDIEDRGHWAEFQAAYEAAFERCPGWHIVPADRKWYRVWAVTQIILETLRDLDLQWPPRSELDDEDLIRRLKEA
jgi:PPK2 family polyphosphate:nucleotide phosphotransferase